MDDKLDFLAEQSTGGVEDARTQEAPAGPSGQPPQEAADVNSQPDGGQAEPRAPVEPGHVPISAMLDEREKRQSLERQLAEIRALQAPPAPLAPTEQLQQALYAQNLRASRKFAEREYGKEAMAAVHDWAIKRADEDPHFNQQAMSSDDPYEFAIEAYNREQVLAAVRPGDLEAFRAWQATQSPGQARTAAPHHQRAPSASLPRSLATAPGNGAAGQAHVVTGPRAAFDTLFSG